MKVTTNQATVDEIMKVVSTQADKPAIVRIFISGYG